MVAYTKLRKIWQHCYVLILETVNTANAVMAALICTYCIHTSMESTNNLHITTNTAQ